MSEKLDYEKIRRYLIEEALNKIGYVPKIAPSDLEGLEEVFASLKELGPLEIEFPAEMNGSIYTHKIKKPIEIKEVSENCSNHNIGLDFLVKSADLIAGRAGTHYFLVDNSRNLFSMKFDSWLDEDEDHPGMSTFYSADNLCKKILGDACEY